MTGFPDGALGVWKTTHRDANGSAVDPSLDSDSVARWTCALVQRISDAHGTGPRVTLPDGTQTFGGVRALETRPDGRRCSPAAPTAGSTRGKSPTGMSCAGRPARTDRRRGKSGATQPLERVRAVLLRKLARDTAETNGPNSFQFKSSVPARAPAGDSEFGLPPDGHARRRQEKPKLQGRIRIRSRASSCSGRTGATCGRWSTRTARTSRPCVRCRSTVTSRTSTRWRRTRRPERLRVGGGGGPRVSVERL